VIDSLGDSSHERALFAHRHVGFVKRRLEVVTVTLPPALAVVPATPRQPQHARRSPSSCPHSTQRLTRGRQATARRTV
jgi:hypothetical protein